LSAVLSANQCCFPISTPLTSDTGDDSVRCHRVAPASGSAPPTRGKFQQMEDEDAYKAMNDEEAEESELAAGSAGAAAAAVGSSAKPDYGPLGTQPSQSQPSRQGYRVRRVVAVAEANSSRTSIARVQLAAAPLAVGPVGADFGEGLGGEIWHSSDGRRAGSVTRHHLRPAAQP
uniref:Os01g0772700 protein n=1 Tax=Macrostomum lignano TaxID=282301 RepID=A0A1I8FRJ9_9PLAT